MTVLHAIPAQRSLPAPRRETPPVAIPRPREGAHRAAPAHALRPETTRERRTAQRGQVPAAPRRQVPPAVHGAASAAFTIVARAGSLTTLAAMLVLGGAAIAATDGTPPPADATVHTLQGP
ncbi:hypothetical protein GCM10009836_70200 [Pseudonocardia ailaonensis]|uniref:Uncharacterized protein n=1 Tax=Pseudonocardia ailaonensis TaxID=367279 RepID=A0ABN2NT03_9PSEU